MTVDSSRDFDKTVDGKKAGAGKISLWLCKWMEAMLAWRTLESFHLLHCHIFPLGIKLQL